jgi:hypothetical protein
VVEEEVERQEKEERVEKTELVGDIKLSYMIYKIICFEYIRWI